MWKCGECGRIFEKEKQVHSCHKTPLEDHFKNKDQAKDLFDYLVERVNTEIGKCKIISIPCCVHLFGKYDFLAILPKRDGLEIRLALGHKLENSRIIQSVPLSLHTTKYCFKINSKKEIDSEFMGWLKEAYSLKDNV